MKRRPPGSTRTDTLVPDTTLFRSFMAGGCALGRREARNGVPAIGVHLACIPFGEVVEHELRRREGSRLVSLGAQAEMVVLGEAAVLIVGRDPDLRRSEERRVGKECVSTCRSRWSPYH